MDNETKDNDKEIGSIYSITFSHGTITPENEPKFRCEMISEKKNPQRVKKIIVTHGEMGTSFSSNADEASPINDCIVIRNQKTNSVRLFSNKYFLLCPYLSNENKRLPAETNNIVPNSTIRNLNIVLGSKKIKRQLAQSERMDANLSNVEKSMKKAIEQNELVVDTEITTQLISNETYLPPCNRDAKFVDQVYKVEDLVSHEILFELEGFAQKVIKADVPQLATDSRLSQFFLKAILYVSKNPLNVKLLLFADSLVKFLKEPSRTLKSKTPIICSYSSAINKKILNEFCVSSMGSTKIRTASTRDKALCYIIVILLIIGQFRVDINLLSGNVSRREYTRLPMLMKAIGAREERSAPTVFHLKLPLSQLPLNRSGMKSTGK